MLWAAARAAGPRLCRPDARFAVGELERAGAVWHGACFNRAKDIVVPTDFKVSHAERERTRAAAEAAMAERCEASDGHSPGEDRASSRDLLFMSGSVSNSAPWYSQRVRQEFHNLHSGTPGVTFVVGKWNISQMRASTFCLAVSSRTSDRLPTDSNL